MVLSDGAVLTYDGDGNCNKLTPDIHGSYLNGTWTPAAHMNDGRLFFASVLLTNGNVFVAGGEYGAGHDHAELYDPLNNVWTRIPDPVSGVGFSDAISKILPNGNVLVAPVSQFGGCKIYNVVSNNWQTAASALNQNEVCWVKLPNDNIVTIDTGAQTSEHYVPSLNQWIVDGNLPVPVYGYGAEIGAGFLLPNGKVFYIGGNTNTAIYTPGSTVSSAGSWVASATIPNGLGAVDAPAAMMLNGKILCALGPVGGFNGPTGFYEYDYTTDSFAPVNSPTGGPTYSPSAPFGTSMLDLPDGTVLFIGGQNSTSLYIYTPDGTPLPAGQPSISGISENSDGSYHLIGIGLNGISEGAAYGDDEQMDSNYPLVRMTNNATGNVYYARTFSHSSTSVMTSNRVLTTEFSLPQNLPVGNYSLVAVANGNPSAAQSFTYSPPVIPTGLTAKSGSNTFVNLQWNASAGATAYNVKRAATSGGYFATLATINGTSYTNSGLTNGINYYYKVAAVGSGGPSADSAAVSATPFGPPPVPTGLTATGGANAQVPLFWNPSYSATNYNLKRATVSGGPYITIANLRVTNYTDIGVNNGTTYYYVVSSVGTNGESANSAQASATPLLPVLITWFKADAITGLGNGGAVSSWTDSSAHGFAAAQATTGQRPTYQTAAMNGLPVVRFNSASSQNLTFNRPVQDNFTMFCVFRSTQGLGAGTLFYQGAGLVNGEVANTVNDLGTCLFANGQVCAGTGNPDVAVNSAAGYNDGNPHLMTFRRNKISGEVNLFMDGNFVGTTPGNTNSLTAPTKLALGAVQTGINFLSGDISEVKIYSSALSDLDRQVQEGTLVGKWGVSLPASPSGFVAQAFNGQVQLNWNPYPTATNYFIKRSANSGGPYLIIGTSAATNYLDATVVNGVTYYYVVSAVNTFTESANSAQVVASPAAPAVRTWFKADALTGLANGAAVGSWSDSSGSGFTATQTTPSQRPTYSSSAMNGMPAVHFNNAASSSLGFNRPVQDDFTILCVFRSTQGLNSGNLFWQGAGLVNGEVSGVANDFGTCLFANGQLSAGTGNTDVSVNSTVGYNDGNPHLMVFKRTGGIGRIDLYMDSVFAGSVTNATTNSLTGPARLVLGAQQTGNYFLNGDISEVKFFTNALTDTVRAIEETTLECKYGIPSVTPPLAAPSGLNGTGGNRQIMLGWFGVSGAATYNLSSSTISNGPFTSVAASLSTTSFTDTNAMIGQTNYYRISAANGCNVGTTSPAIAVFLPQPTLTLATADSATLTVSWPVWATDWNLYYATNLVPPISWLLVTNAVVNTNNQIITTLQLDADARFFRLSFP